MADQITPDPEAEEQRVIAQRLADEAYRRIGTDDDPAGIDDEAGSLLEQGWHLLRTGSTVVLSTWQGKWATELDTEKAAKAAFKKLAAERED